MNHHHPTLASSAAMTTEEGDDDVGTCSICFVAFSASEADQVPQLLKCGHSFCTACLARLLLGSSTTPAPEAEAEAEQTTCALKCPKCRTVTQVLLGDGEAAAAAVGREGPATQL
jgi:ferredoxin